jgi:hypothetical protein
METYFLDKLFSHVQHLGVYLLQMKENKNVLTQVGILHLVKFIGLR